MYSEPVEDETCGFSYLAILLSRSAISNLSRSISASRAATLSLDVAPSRDTVSRSSRFSTANLASSSRRRTVSDLGPIPIRGYGDQ